MRMRLELQAVPSAQRPAPRPLRDCSLPAWLVLGEGLAGPGGAQVFAPHPELHLIPCSGCSSRSQGSSAPPTQPSSQTGPCLPEPGELNSRLPYGLTPQNINCISSPRTLRPLEPESGQVLTSGPSSDCPSSRKHLKRGSHPGGMPWSSSPEAGTGA